MAKPAWVTTNPSSGSGSGQFNLGGSGQHTGRSARSGTVTVQNQHGGKPSVAIAVSQDPKSPFFTSAENVITANVVASGGTTETVIDGSSNAPFTTNAKSFKLVGSNASLIGAGKMITKMEYSINGGAYVAVGTLAAEMVITPAGDPGAANQYTVKLRVTVSANSLATSRYLYFMIKPNETGDTWEDVNFGVNQNAATSTLSLSKTKITLNNAGTAQAIQVTSNDDWRVF